MGEFGIGASVRRKEDVRFLTGRGTYTDDIDRPRQLQTLLFQFPDFNIFDNRFRGKN